ncbi:MAG: hypothetical protein ACFFD4_02115 [Candidatus Odinarchaeota archaeon]
MNSEQREQEKVPKYEDFITSVADPVKVISEKEGKLAREHPKILVTLGRKNMTVKEIHNLFWDSEEKKHTKTIKTIYRYLDALEEADLVKVAGHRKPVDSRMTEKLYCRTAIVFFDESQAKEPGWWTTEEGEKQVQKLTTVAQKFFGIAEEKDSAFQELLRDYFGERTRLTNELLMKMAKEDALAEIFRGHGIDDIKFFIGTIGELVVFLKQPDLLEQLKQLINTDPDLL